MRLYTVWRVVLARPEAGSLLKLYSRPPAGLTEGSGMRSGGACADVAKYLVKTYTHTHTHHSLRPLFSLSLSTHSTLIDSLLFYIHTVYQGKWKVDREDICYGMIYSVQQSSKQEREKKIRVRLLAALLHTQYRVWQERSLSSLAPLIFSLGFKGLVEIPVSSNWYRNRYLILRNSFSFVKAFNFFLRSRECKTKKKRRGIPFDSVSVNVLFLSYLLLEETLFSWYIYIYMNAAPIQRPGNSASLQTGFILSYC